MRTTKNDPEVWKGLAAGLAGGLAGSLAMNLFHSAFETLQRKREEQTRKSRKHLGQAPSPMHIQMSSHPAAEESFWNEEFIEEMEEHPPYREKHSTAPPPLSRDQMAESATVRAASTVSEKVLGHDLTEREKEIAEPMVHYLFGSSIGMLYGVSAEYMPVIGFAEGIPFGACVMVATEEIASPVMRLALPASLHDRATHLYSLVSHIIYGLTCETVRKQVRRMLN